MIWHYIWYCIKFKSKAGCLLESQFAIIFVDTEANPNPYVAKQDGAQLEMTQDMQEVTKMATMTLFGSEVLTKQGLHIKLQLFP